MLFSTTIRRAAAIATVAGSALLAPLAAHAQTAPTPAPSPKPTPNPFSYRGYVRAYDFFRTNASTLPGGAGQVNQQSFNAALSLHGEYKLPASGFTVGASYLYANPFNGCSSATSHLLPPCGKVAAPSLNPDDTLPGFELSTLYEAWVQYKDAHLFAKVGDQLITTPWANAADSRLKPAAFEGADVAYALDKRWTLEAMDMIRFESRTNASFDNKTLLTSFPAGSPGLPGNFFYAGGNGVTTAGFTYGRVGYNANGLASNVHYYHFADIANLAWFDAKYTAPQKTKPFIAVQAGTERDTGASRLGRTDADAFGLQIGAAPTRTLAVSLGYNQIPRKIDTLAALPAGIACNAKLQATVAKGATFPYFLGSNAPQCAKNANGTYSVDYGGIASPYTDSYATDPLFSTSLTQGMADRRAPGDGAKLAATYTTVDKRAVFTMSQAYYNYGTFGQPQQTEETDADLTLYANPFPKAGAYKGLFLRYRYGERRQSNVAIYGGLPVFKYNRAQLEYDF